MIDDWPLLAGEATAWFTTTSHSAGAALVRRVAEICDPLPHLDLRATGVRVRLPLAEVASRQAISAAAGELGFAADPSVPQTLRLTIEALDPAAVTPFWHTALAYACAGDDLVDPMRRDPSIHFRRRDDPRPLRNRIHLDVVRPGAQIRDAVDALEASGGQRMRASAYHVALADAEGNEVDLVSGAGLDDSEDTADWRSVFGGMAFYLVASPRQAAELAVVAAGLADDAGVPLMVDLHAGGVTFDSGKDLGETEGFVDLARRIQAAARGMGLTAEPTRLRFVQVGIDAVDVPVVREFWRAVLGYENDPRPDVTDLNDPRRLNPTLFFQPMAAADEARRRQRNRTRFELVVPENQVQVRIETALAAGGRVGEQGEIVDPEGNELRIGV